MASSVIAEVMAPVAPEDRTGGGSVSGQTVGDLPCDVAFCQCL